MAIAWAEVMSVPVSEKPERTPEGIRMGNEIEAIRKEGPFTQQQVADRLDLRLSTYLGYRRGYTMVTRNTLPKWAHALNYPLVQLAERLGIDLLSDVDASGLRQELAVLLPDAEAAELDELARDLATLPPFDRRQVLDGWRDHMTGRLTRLGRA